MRKLNKLLEREAIPASEVSVKLLSVLSCFVLELSPFAPVSKMDDEPTVDRAVVALECYLRLLSLERSSELFHPTLFESSFQIMANIFQHYTVKEGRTYTLLSTAKSLLSGPCAVLAGLFASFSLPEQYQESTIAHIFDFFRLSCIAQYEPEYLDRALVQLCLSKDSSVMGRVEVTTFNNHLFSRSEFSTLPCGRR